MPDILDFITSIQGEKAKKFKKKKKVEIKKRGRKPIYSDDAFAKISFVQLSKGITEFKSLWRYLKDNPEVRKKCGLDKLPNRTTLMRRLKNFSPDTPK